MDDWQRYGYASYEAFISSKAGACPPENLGTAHAGRYVDGAFVPDDFLAYRGKEGCTNPTCTRNSAVSERCYGWHCPRCHEACSSQGHKCGDDWPMPEPREPNCPPDADEGESDA